MMGRMTAYDQNGRMVSDFDKSDYDFLCSYGMMPEEVLEESAKLRKENDTLCHRIDELCAENERLRQENQSIGMAAYDIGRKRMADENAKLRKLVWDMYGNYRTGWNEVIEEELYNRMLELGVVDE